MKTERMELGKIICEECEHLSVEEGCFICKKHKEQFDNGFHMYAFAVNMSCKLKEK